MPRNTRSLRIDMSQPLENYKYMYNLNSEHVLDMQPPYELNNTEKNWFEKQLRYRQPTNRAMTKGHGTTQSSANEGPIAVNILQPGSQGLQE